ncbi:MAG: PBECR2 nuclease fold domain-containing protein [Nanoarchaeota archaeon]
MNNVFEITDKNGKRIRLTDKQHTHMMEEHPYMHEYIENIKETLQKPDRIANYGFDEDIFYFYKSYKNLPPPNRFLLVIVKYLNGEGFIVSSYLEKNIK